MITYALIYVVSHFLDQPQSTFFYFDLHHIQMVRVMLCEMQIEIIWPLIEEVIQKI